jgi:riboflavin transporter FmnP
MEDFRHTLSGLGPIKDPVLVASSTFSIFVVSSSKELVLQGHWIGPLMDILAGLVFLIALAFYIYAFLRLPSTTQEAVFKQGAEATVKSHKQSIAKIKSKKSG